MAGKAKGFTLMFEAMCLLLLWDLPVASVARFVGEGDTRLWQMLGRHVDEARESKDLAGVEAVACDELAIRKGHVRLLGEEKESTRIPLLPLPPNHALLHRLPPRATQARGVQRKIARNQFK